MTGERGLVISSPIRVVGTSLSMGGGLDPHELRFSLLFWDKLDFPDNNIISFGSDADAQFLQSAGILNRTRVQVVGSGDGAQMFLAAYLHAFNQLDAKEPGVWSLGAGKNSVSFPTKELEDGRGILVSLYDAVPVPDKDIPLQDILEFKAKRRAELLALRSHLDEIYQRILAAGDGHLALQSETAKLEAAISDYIKVAQATKLPFVGMSFDANLNVPAAVAAGLAAYSQGLGTVSSLLTGAAAGFAVGPTASLKRHKESATPFRYISSYHKRLF